jgi:hypothetical protein
MSANRRAARATDPPRPLGAPERCAGGCSWVVPAVPVGAADRCAAWAGGRRARDGADGPDAPARASGCLAPVAPQARAPSGPAPRPTTPFLRDPRLTAVPGAIPPRPALTGAAAEVGRGPGPSLVLGAEACARPGADAHRVDALVGTFGAGPPADAERAGTTRHAVRGPRSRRAGEGARPSTTASPQAPGVALRLRPGPSCACATSWWCADGRGRRGAPLIRSA